MADHPRKPFNLLANKQRSLAGKIYTMPVSGVKKVNGSSKPAISLSDRNTTHKVTNRSPQSTLSVRQSITPAGSRQGSKEPRNPIKQIKTQKAKRSSPIATTPQWANSEDEDDQADQPRKRVKIDRRASVDDKRQLRDGLSFQVERYDDLEVVHAVDIANDKTMEHGRYQYGAYFTALAEEEDECPTVKLQYPSNCQREIYQLVKPTDQSDFKPLSEIMDNMEVVADFYLDDVSAQMVTSSEDGSGLVEKLQRAARDGSKGRAGAQTKFIQTITEYNKLIAKKCKDGTISKRLDEMGYPPLKLVQHIVKDQIYARTVSPQVDLVRDYEGFSDNVYGELLPKFLSRIFHETHLKSDQIFVDLGSGVGNCVLQAALEVGCESWGCEVMENPALLAEAQAKEFPGRCQMWGIKPGKVRLIRDSFLENKETREILRRADVVLVNNQAFTPVLNDKLKYMFLDLKEGCQIVSLKCFRDPGHKVKETNINDPVNVLSVVEKERFSGMVSWTDDPGKWYLHKKDSVELRAVQRRLERASK